MLWCFLCCVWWAHTLEHPSDPKHINKIESFGMFLRCSYQLHPTSTRHPARAWTGTTKQQLFAPVVRSCVQPDAWWLQDVMAFLRMTILYQSVKCKREFRVGFNQLVFLCYRMAPLKFRKHWLIIILNYCATAYGVQCNIRLIIFPGWKSQFITQYYFDYIQFVVTLFQFSAVNKP